MERATESLAGIVLLPLVVAAFTCSVIGSFVIWRVRIALAGAAAHTVPFDLHLLHDERANRALAALACGVGLIALALPVSLLLQAAA